MGLEAWAAVLMPLKKLLLTLVLTLEATVGVADSFVVFPLTGSVILDCVTCAGFDTTSSVSDLMQVSLHRDTGIFTLMICQF